MKKLIINALFYGFLLIISPANAEEDTETYNATPDGVVVLYINPESVLHLPKANLPGFEPVFFRLSPHDNRPRRSFPSISV